MSRIAFVVLLLVIGAAGERLPEPRRLCRSP
jgi:hypothetical protein